jgi:HTH-type transcriptional regulator/antitoxin HigA
VSETLRLFEEFKSPGEALRQLLAEKGWTQEEFAEIAGTSRQTVAQILSDRSGVTPEMATLLAAALGTTSTFWLGIDSTYRLAQVNHDRRDVEHRARLYSLGPIRDMQKRGWIRDTKDVAVIENDLKSFFAVEDLESLPPCRLATRRATKADGDLTLAQRAWYFRARSLAKALAVGRFSGELDAMRSLTNKVRELAAYPKEARHLPKLLAQFGIRFVVIESLPGAKIDGATFWLDDRSPVIAVSVRYDRIDSFWFTVMHELSHVRHCDSLSIDTDLDGDDADPDQRVLIDSIEQRANVEAAAYLIPASELDSFIRRVSPLFSRDRIIQFSHSVKIHPGIVIGQLQNRGELHSSNNRDLLVKIRAIIIETALTDGWGKTISPEVLA